MAQQESTAAECCLAVTRPLAPILPTTLRGRAVKPLLLENEEMEVQGGYVTY